MFGGDLSVLMILLIPPIFLGSEGSRSTAEPASRWKERTILSHHSSLSPTAVQSIQILLLRRLGLQGPPVRKPGFVVPQYLLDLYRFHSGESPVPMDSESHFPERHAEKTNTVRGFHHLDSLSNSKEAQEENPLCFIFNISSVPHDEELKGLELRLYRKEREIQGRRGLQKVNLYHMTGPCTSQSRGRLLDSRLLDSDQPKWESFDATSVLKWTPSWGKELGFVVEVLPINGSHCPHHQGGHLRVRRCAGEDEVQWSLERPLLVTYSHDGRSQPFTPRIKRSLSHTRSSRWNAYQRTAMLPNSRNKRTGKNQKRKKGRSRCRRQPLFVDFKDIGWDQWIVAPNGYHAFFCHGDCRFPLADHMNSSSHAMVQTLVNSVNSRVPMACCVPTVLGSVAMLYLDQDDMVVLKNYQDMVVEGCGCR